MKNKIIQQSLLKTERNISFEFISPATVCINETSLDRKWYHNIKYILAGILLGIVLVKGQVSSWFRIQEMFRLQSLYLYKVMTTAIVVGIISVSLIKMLNIKTASGEPIAFQKKKI